MYVDTLRIVDARRESLMGRFWRSQQSTVWFCDRCGSVCDGACRRKTIVEPAREKAVLERVRFS